MSLRCITDDWIKEDHLDEWKEFASNFVAKTRKEKGCQEFYLLQDDKDKMHFVFVETWQDWKTVNKHMAASNFLTFVAKRKKVRSKDTVARTYRKII